MLRRFVFAGGLFLFSLAGCKNGSLAAREAASALNASLFAPQAAVQTLSFATGETRTPQAYAIDGFLYAKHWLVCKSTEPGPFSRVAVCTLDAAGKTFASENKWTQVRGIGTCADCIVWSVPLARATLRSVTDVSPADKTHAVVTYGYDVIPNTFGGELGAWMTTNASAWCGPDPRAAGAWGQMRTGKANFARAGGKWRVEPAAGTADFASLFGGPAPERPCVP